MSVQIKSTINNTMPSYTPWGTPQQPQPQPQQTGLPPYRNGYNPNQPKQTPAASAQTPQFDMNSMVQAFLAAQAQQGDLRLQGQREFLSGQHKAMDGVNIDPNTGRSQANPFDTGFFQNSASQMTPEARLASQGPSAMNQWGAQGGVQGVDPTELARLNDVRASSYQPHAENTGVTMGATSTAIPNYKAPGSLFANADGGQDLIDGANGGVKGFTRPGGIAQDIAKQQEGAKLYASIFGLPLNSMSTKPQAPETPKLAYNPNPATLLARKPQSAPATVQTNGYRPAWTPSA